MWSGRAAFPILPAAAPLAFAALLAGCAVPVPRASPAPAAAAVPAPAAAAPAAGAAAGAAGPAARPFAEVLRDAREIPGFLGLWQKDERLWLELRPEQFERPFLLAAVLATGVGEGGLYPGAHATERLVEFRRVHQQVQLVALNQRVRVPAGPLARAVADSVSDSLVASTTVVSQPHPERASVLVDALPLLMTDLLGLQTALDAAFRLGHALDPRHGSVVRVRSGEAGASFRVRQHFAIGRLPARPVAGAPGPSLPVGLPDPRSLFLDVAVSWQPLPDAALPGREADPRIGHFTRALVDFSRDTAGRRTAYLVERWRLVRRDPAAPVSPPREPIVVWMDRNIPLDYRDAVRAGILAWNEAFERAGFRDAIEVRQQPDDADFDLRDAGRHVAVRWFAMEGPGALAFAPTLSDPRSGEILRAYVMIPDNWARLGRAEIAEIVPAADRADAQGSCSHAAGALAQAAFGLALLESRGAIAPDGPEARRFVQASLRDVAMHEMGHALGLRHNFRASAGVLAGRLRDPDFVRRHGISHSVMDYLPLNLGLDGEPEAPMHQGTLGAYDHWAIEYAYRELAPAEEADALRRIAERARDEPELAYATDADAAPAGRGIDPRVNPYDLGDDPLLFQARRFALSRELWRRTGRGLPAGQTYALYRRNLERGMAQIALVAPQIAKHVGGVYVSRELDHPRAALLEPVPAARQRAALELLARELYAADSFRIDPQYLRRLGLDHLERDALPGGGATGGAAPDFSLATRVLGIQRATLDVLMSEATAVRLADAEARALPGEDPITLAEVHARLVAAIWSELEGGATIDSLRRNLQRDHARRLATALLRAAPAAAADLRAVQRAEAVGLVAAVERALARGRFRGVVRAHLEETRDTLAVALRAQAERSPP